MIVLGIDPGFTVTGFSIVSKIKGKETIIDAGFIALPAKESLQVRIAIFYDFFCEKIKIHQITVLAIETPFLGKNVQSFLKLGYLRGVLYLLAEQHKLVLREYSPREVKLAITGFGGAQKEQVARVLSMMFPHFAKPKEEDVTDAIAIGLCGLWQKTLPNL